MFMPEVVQVVPHDNYTVDVQFQDGKCITYDVKPLLQKGVFERLRDKQFFKERCTVMNHTLAWDLSGHFDPTNCLDLDPEELYRHSFRDSSY